MQGLSRRAAVCAASLLLTFLAPVAGARADDTEPRIDLRVLVVDDGGAVTAAVAAELDGAGTPYTEVDLSDAGRPQIDAAFLSDTVDGRPRAKYQAVVLPNDNPFGAGSAEMAALASYEQTYGIRQVDAYTFAQPAVGLNWAENPGYMGSLDGVTAQVTAAGLAGPFGYLDGPVPFEDNAADVSESYGYLSVPLAQQAEGATFTSYVEAPIPGTAVNGSLIGEYAHDGRRELVVTFVYNEAQQQYRLLARGIVEWMTQGVHLGADRNYFAVHVDDVFGADDRWDTVLNCTPGDVDCPEGQGTADPIRMTVADAQYAKQWSQEHGLTLDFMFNGAGSETYKEENGGADALTDQLVADKDAFRWVNHTYDHPFLGCVQNVTVVPWVCSTDAAGNVQWVSQAEITAQIVDNRNWAATKGLDLDNTELVTGEHSGMRVLPQQVDDNPNLAPALAATGVTALGSDNSRDPQQRQVGAALTVPRFPINIFYNAAKQAEQVDEYNWIYTSAADGGSGICDNSTTTTCLDAPLDTATGYTSYLVPTESRIALGHALSNNPRPHYIHQSNLAEERIAYPVLEKVLSDYAGLFADNTPLVNQGMSETSAELANRAAWDAAVDGGQVTAYRIGNAVTISAPSGVQAPVTLPAGTDGFGSPYAGARSGWTADGSLEAAAAATAG
ncbi:hypothetical protein ACFWFF_04420, partial [Streptomyces sp. NPDC060223]|uniref:hypothetical protein n=1 Tax=unclassified Streptomyces TaxID=2593676 RepID=UPI00363CE982